MPEKGTKALKELLKKNQLMISALAIMIAVAGYLQFAENELGNEDYLTGGEDSQMTSGEVVENLTSEDMSGTYDFNVVVKARTFQEVCMFVAKCLAPMKGVTSTATHFVLRRYKEMDIDLCDDSDDRRKMSL